MSTIRFIHTDFLRLAHSMQGVTSAPGWLQEAMTDATRRATRQVIETAISEDADFLLIAGSVTDSNEDLEIVCAWLDEQLVVARRAGIQIVAVSDHENEARSLRRICDVIVDRHQYLLANRTPTGEVRLTISSTRPANHGELSISFDDQHIHTDGANFHYHVLCGQVPGSPIDLQEKAYVHRATAGAIQAASPEEQWNGGCLVVSADLNSRTVRATPVDVSSIRYVTNQLSIEGRTKAGRLVEEIAMASRNIHRDQSETVLVDWVINASVDTGRQEARGLESESLLASLRTDLHSGHHGVWPRSVRFTDQSTLHVSADDCDSINLLEEVASDARYAGNGSNAITSALLCSLTALQEAA